MSPLLLARGRCAVAVVMWAGLAVVPLQAQTTAVQAPPAPSAGIPQWQTAAGSKMEFEVASVRPSAPGTPYGTSVSLDGLDGPVSGSLFSANASLHSYLLFAYKISDSNQARGIFFKLPAWAKPPQFFDVEARADGVPTRDQLRLMMQALLADRFKLAIHWEMQQHEEYVLVLSNAGKPGPQLQPHASDEVCVKSPAAIIAAPAKGTEIPRYCGIVTWRVDGQQHIRMTDVTIAQMASAVSGLSGSLTAHSGVDSTGLTGQYDLDLQFVPEVSEGRGVSGPTFADALKNQLGLNLAERKQPMEMLVIDHVEKPSEN
jgi:bla regulator protein blaR1